jgi:hypothetical protein
MEEQTVTYCDKKTGKPKTYHIDRLPCPQCQCLDNRVWACAISGRKKVLIKFYTCRKCGYEYTTKEHEYIPKGPNENAKGSMNVCAKLDEEKVRQIRLAYQHFSQSLTNEQTRLNSTDKDMALYQTIKHLKLQHLSKDTIKRVIKYKTWKHVTL